MKKMETKTKMNEIIRRSYPAEFRANKDSGIIEGIPIVFGEPTDICGFFQETIERGAIPQELLDPEADVRFFWNHNFDEKAIARTRIPLSSPAGMELTAEEKNVHMRANPNRKRTDVNDLCLAIEDGTINAMSFCFVVSEDRWEDLDTDYPKRYITKIDRVIEVSAVNFPAYASTEIHARHDCFAETEALVLEKAREKRAAEAENSAKTPTANAEIKSLIMRYKK